MTAKIVQTLQRTIFKSYQINTILPFQIIQAPFRKFNKYDRDGHWNQKQKLKYTVFLIFFKDLLQDIECKRYTRIYEMMSDMIITRNPNQCRSHHQKMQKYHKSIPMIISCVTSKIEPGAFKEIEVKYTCLIKTLLQNSDKYVRDTLPVQSSKNRSRDMGLSRQLTKKNSQVSKKETYVIIQNTVVKEQVEDLPPKKCVKSTGFSYSDYEGVQEQKVEGEEFIPDFANILKQEEDVNQGIYYSQVENDELLMEQKKFTEKMIMPTLSQQISNTYFFPITLKSGQDNQIYCIQELNRLQFQKQWRLNNAENLMKQYNDQMELIKVCEQKIEEIRLSIGFKQD